MIIMCARSCFVMVVLGTARLTGQAKGEADGLSPRGINQTLS